MVLVVVNYNQEEEVIQFLGKVLERQTQKPDNIYIVNNQSKHIDLLRAFAQNNQLVKLVEADHNVGYLPAAHLAYKQHVAEFDIPDLFILCNTDIELDTPDFLAQIAEKYGNSDYGLVGPNVRNETNGKLQNPMYVKRLPKSKLQQLVKLFSSYWLYNIYYWLHQLKPKKNILAESGAVYAVHGSFLILTKAFFAAGGTTDYPMFLFGEELYLAEQCRALNLKVYYDSSVSITHNEHSTTGGMKHAKLVALRNSLKYILETYYR